MCIRDSYKVKSYDHGLQMDNMVDMPEYETLVDIEPIQKNKTISDHIDAWGAEGKKFTKEEMKNLQIAAQEDGIMPSMDSVSYTHLSLQNHK